jgi:hypothetical protein
MTLVNKCKAKEYVKWILDAIECEDQTNKNLFGINTCFYLNMPFEHLQKLTEECPIEIKEEVQQEFYECIKPYKKLFDYPTVQGFSDWLTELANSYICIVLSDIVDLGDSRDYPKGLYTTSEYFEDLFKEHIIFYKSITINDFPKVAEIFDNGMLELRNKIKEQRELDNI